MGSTPLQSKPLLKLYLLVKLFSSSLNWFLSVCLLAYFSVCHNPHYEVCPIPNFWILRSPFEFRQVDDFATNIITTVQHIIPNNKYTTKCTLFTAVKVHTWQVLDFSGRCTHFPPIARLLCRSAYSGMGSVTPNASFSQWRRKRSHWELKMSGGGGGDSAKIIVSFLSSKGRKLYTCCHFS